MNVRLDDQMVLAVIWFFIGFGAGYTVIRLWKVLIAAIAIAVLLPIILSITGMSLPITSENVINAFLSGLNMFARLIASNQYSAIGFLLGVALGVTFFFLRGRG
ncbi:MAG: hypothetical protein QW614_01245 [Candidatus Caldarchaeum sp.]|uniref:Uncharacterized protein n=1 Tax=Caldiarchaeum subterraneum TaxID=311458 RepID=A0A7C5LAJ7_CALS0